MRQFDIYANTDPDSNRTYPYFVDVQTDMLDVLNTRVVIPLTSARPNAGMPKHLCPRVEIDGELYYLLTHQLTTVPASILREHQGSLESNRTDIINALDFIFSGI